MVTSKFLTVMSLSKESFSTISACAFSASSLRPMRSSVSSESTGVIRSDSPYQSRGVLLSGLQLVVPPGVLLVGLPGVEELGADRVGEIGRPGLGGGLGGRQDGKEKEGQGGGEGAGLHDVGER